MNDFNRSSPEWLAIREYAAARQMELTIAMRERQPYEALQEKQTRIEELGELIERFSAKEIDQSHTEITFGF